MNPTENWYVMVFEVMQWENVRTSTHLKTPLFLDKSNGHELPDNSPTLTRVLHDPMFMGNIQSLASDSAIGNHLSQNPTCAQHYDDSRFSILVQGRSPFHLSALEATFIKTSNPTLCPQKEFVDNLKIVH